MVLALRLVLITTPLLVTRREFVKCSSVVILVPWYVGPAIGIAVSLVPILVASVTRSSSPYEAGAYGCELTDAAMRGVAWVVDRCDD